MIETLAIASLNEGKVQELRELLNHLSIKLISQKELAIPEIEETGLTFVENAILKARHVAKLSGLPTLADDSGLSVDALGGAPGIYSARYAGPEANDQDRIRKLLHELKNVSPENRTARFHCVIALLREEIDPAPILCHGQWEGMILTEPRGNHGFGYDPIFYLPNQKCSVAELSNQDKLQLSHRGQAIGQLYQVLKTEVN